MRLLDYDHMPPVAAVMTPFPHSVRPDDPVRRALDLMQQHQVRHVPVTESDEITGIVSDRDLRWLESDTHSPAEPDGVRINAVQTPNPYTVELTTPLARVLEQMVDRQISAAIVTKSGRLAGIVTVSDVCRALAALLDQRYGENSPDDVA
jgi:CBS domain-containing protein